MLLNGSSLAMLDHHPEWHRDDNDQLIDTKIFHSESLQRPYQYLKRYSEGKSLNTVNPGIPEDEPADCLKVLIRYAFTVILCINLEYVCIKCFRLTLMKCSFCSGIVEYLILLGQN